MSERKVFVEGMELENKGQLDGKRLVALNIIDVSTKKIIERIMLRDEVADAIADDLKLQAAWCRLNLDSRTGENIAEVSE